MSLAAPPAITLASGEADPGPKEISVPALSKSWRSVTVGVADLDAALELWVGRFGLELRARREGPDADLGRFWDLQPEAIRRQSLLATPGQSSGMLHLVEYAQAAPAVREGAAVFDLCPKNLDIYVDDLPRRHAELLAAGAAFRTETWSDVTAPNGIRFREIHMPSHDEINVVLLELVGADLPFSDRGLGAVGPLISIVADADAEKAFYREVIGLQLLSENILQGPEIEQMIGLPPGAALDVSIWGAAEQPLGQVEIIDYRGVEGENRYPRAAPGARGILHVTYRSDDLDALQRKLDAGGIPWTAHVDLDILPGRGRALVFGTPAGMRVEAISGPVR